MTNPQTVKKYLEFANKLQSMAQKEQLLRPYHEAKMQGIGSPFIAHLLAEGYFVKEGNKYKDRWNDPFKEDDIATMLTTINSQASKRRMKRAEKINQAIADHPLTKFSSKELIEELRKRGYSGSLYVKTEIIL